jgi:predicted small metal-binding protein
MLATSASLPARSTSPFANMQMAIECECGWSFQGLEDELVEATRQHARQAHGMDLTRDQVLAAAKPAVAG